MKPSYEMRDLKRFGLGLALTETLAGVWLALTAGAPLFDLGNMALSVAILLWGLATTSAAFTIWAPEGNLRPYQLWRFLSWPITFLSRKRR